MDARSLFGLLSQIPDPEIPVITISELGLLRDVKQTDSGFEVVITPTYTGCPAMKLIEDEVKRVCSDYGVENAKVSLVYSPAWNTDWISEEAREKLKVYGIAPPVKSSCNKWVNSGFDAKVSCPRCGSWHTEVISHFGSTACKALYKCGDCKEPFEYFKCH